MLLQLLINHNCYLLLLLLFLMMTVINFHSIQCYVVVVSVDSDGT